MVLINSPILTTGEAARLAGMTEKTLRNWLDREQVTLPTPRGKTQKRLSMLDCIKLAAVSKAVNYGFNVQFANAAVESAFAGTLDHMKRTPFPHWTALEPIANTYLVIYRDGIGETQSLIANTFEGERIEQLDAFVAINIAVLVRECMRRCTVWLGQISEKRLTQIQPTTHTLEAK